VVLKKRVFIELVHEDSFGKVFSIWISDPWFHVKLWWTYEKGWSWDPDDAMSFDDIDKAVAAINNIVEYSKNWGRSLDRNHKPKPEPRNAGTDEEDLQVQGNRHCDDPIDCSDIPGEERGSDMEVVSEDST